MDVGLRRREYEEATKRLTTVTTDVTTWPSVELESVGAVASGPVDELVSEEPEPSVADDVDLEVSESEEVVVVTGADAVDAASVGLAAGVVEAFVPVLLAGAAAAEVAGLVEGGAAPPPAFVHSPVHFE